jgi:alpha-glucosidase
MVCPVLKKGIKTMQVYLPKGTWYDFWTGESHWGKQVLKAKIKADRIPIFVRAGTTLPTVDIVQNTAEMQNLRHIELSVFAADSGESTFYWDAGEGYGHQAGQYTERTYNVSTSGKKVRLRQTIKGDYNASFQHAQLRFIGLSQPPTKITVDGKKMTTGIFYAKRAVVITVPFNFEEVVIG